MGIAVFGLKVQIIFTDNYLLNVNLFKLFSLSRLLETSVPHLSDNTRKPYVTFDFVHILTSIRNNRLNQKDIRKSFHFPNFHNIKLDYYVYPVQVYLASFSDMRLLYASEKESLANLAPNLTIKACFPSAIER